MEKIIIIYIFIMLNIYSFNCNGLRNIEKVKNVFALLQEWRCDVGLLQETFWTDTILLEIEKLWDGKIIYNNSQQRKCGVAILVSNRLKNAIENVEKDDMGRFIKIKIQYEERGITFVNVYAPNSCKDRVEFFEFIGGKIDHNVIIGGDFNTSLHSNDRFNTIHCYDKAYEKLNKVICENSLYDIWRCRNRNSRTYSWRRNIEGEIKMSRIDYFLVSSEMRAFVKNIFYKETTFSDHSFIFMKLDFSTRDIGPGIWVLNNNFLYENEYCLKIQKLMETEKMCDLYNENMLLWWDNTKYKIKKISQLYGKERSRSKYKEINRIQIKLQNFSDKISRGEQYNIIEYENLRESLARIENEKCQGSILRSKAQWAIEGDKNTKYFLNLENYKRNNKHITELLNENDEEITSTEQIIQHEYNFYSSLYSCVEVEDTNIESFLENIDTTIDDEDRELCDKKIDKSEIFTALKTMSRNKSPGSDGLTMEFYVKFFDVFNDIFFRLFNCIYEKSMMSRSMRHGQITLVYKKKGDRKRLKNWRPINLLNVDYKILARIMSNRLKQVLPKIVSQEQTSCIIGRDISDTIVCVNDIIDIAEREQIEGYLIKIDQEKAFDRVSHKYLMKVLQCMGFGPAFRKWIQIFYTSIYSAVKCNGYLTEYFEVKNSVRQGCPISAMLFVLTAEPLNKAIKLNENIKGISIPYCKKESVIFQHADDTTMTVADVKSIYNIFGVFESYGKASGAKVNKSKSNFMSR